MGTKFDSDNLLSGFGYTSDDIAGAVTDSSVMINADRTQIVRGQTVDFLGDMGTMGKTPAQITFIGGQLTGFTLLRREREGNTPVYTARASISNGKFKIVAKFEDGDIELGDLLTQINNSTRRTKNMPERTRAEVITAIANIGLRYAPVSWEPSDVAAWRGMPIFLEHQGSSEAQFSQMMEMLKPYGLVEQPSTDNGPGVLQRWSFETPMEVSGFEVSRSNADLTGGWGFQDFLHASVSNFLRCMAGWTAFSAKRDAYEAERTAGNLTEEQTREMEAELRRDKSAISGRATSTWGGSHPGTTVQPDGSRTEDGQWYATNVPSGRISVLPAEGNEIRIDFWTQRQQSSDTPTTETTVDTTADDLVEGDPF